MDNEQPTNSDIIKMNLDNKQASQDFKITTMEDDLKRASGILEDNKKSFKENDEAPLKKEPMTIPTPPLPPTPALTPISTTSTPPPSHLADIPDFLLEDAPPKGGKMKSFLLGFIVVLIVGSLGFGGWWYYITSTGKTQVTPTPTPSPVTAPSDASLISVDKSIKLEVEANEDSKTFFSKLSLSINDARKDSTLKSIVRVIPATQKKILTLDELSSITGIEIPSLVNHETFTLVAYIQNENPAWGLILKTASDEAKTKMMEKESNLPEIARDLYMNYANDSLPKGQSEKFLDNNFEGVNIRYMNFDIPERALDYGFSDDLLLFASSREAMFALIERAKLRESVSVKE